MVIVLGAALVVLPRKERAVHFRLDAARHRSDIPWPGAGVVAMTEIALFRSVLGVGAGVRDAAARFRTASPAANIVDQFDGIAFDENEPAFAPGESPDSDEAMVAKAPAAGAVPPACPVIPSTRWAPRVSPGVSDVDTKLIRRSCKEENPFNR